MDPVNPQSQNHGPNPTPARQDDKPIPFDSVEARPAAVSRQPISLGAGPSGPVAAPRPAAPVQPRPAPAAPKPVLPATGPTNQGQKASGGQSIIGMKTFFAKLHAGSLTFLEEQIAGWLKENPSVTIKATNITVGEVQAKVTEPNLIVVVWF